MHVTKFLAYTLTFALVGCAVDDVDPTEAPTELAIGPEDPGLIEDAEGTLVPAFPFADPAAVPAQFVCVYEHINYGGRYSCWSFPSTTNTYWTWKISDQTRMYGCSAAGCMMNDMASSFYVWRAGASTAVFLAWDYPYGGHVRCSTGTLDGGDHDLRIDYDVAICSGNGVNFNDRASSIRVKRN